MLHHPCGTSAQLFSLLKVFESRPRDFPSLTEFIASDADHTSLVFKRFDKLAARNLLYLQSELAELQARQNEFDAQDRSFEHSGREVKECAIHWERLKDAVHSGDEWVEGEDGACNRNKEEVKRM